MNTFSRNICSVNRFTGYRLSGIGLDKKHLVSVPILRTISIDLNPRLNEQGLDPLTQLATTWAIHFMNKTSSHKLS